MQMTPEMMQLLMQFAGNKGGSGGQGLLPMLMGGQGQGGGLPGMGGFNPNTPGINSDPRAQQTLDSMQMNRGGAPSMGPPNFQNVGAAQGFSPEGANHNKAMQDMAMGGGNAMAGGGGMDPKTKMMMMVAGQLFNDSQKKGEPVPQDVSVGANSINVGQMPNLDPGSYTSQMAMQRGAPRQYGMGGGMLEDPRKRRQPRFLFGG